MAMILLIEDEQPIRERLASMLSANGHGVISAAKGTDGVHLAVAEDPDVIVLDLGLPDIHGGEVLKMIRAVSAVPIIVATAQNSESDIVTMLDRGADDYLVKPFGVAQLEARIRAVLRRHGSDTEATSLVFGELTIDLAGQEAHLDGKLVELTPREFELLAYIASNVGRVVSKRELMAEVWRQPYGGADKTLDVHISWLRRKLGESAAEPRFILTKRGAGIRFVDPTA
jgi:DNA-binding response OmpR family regulator